MGDYGPRSQLRTSRVNTIGGSQLRSFGLRWLTIYIPLFCFQPPFWNPLIQWVGRALLKLPYPVLVAETGSGDRTADYIRVGCAIVLAVVGATVWTLFDRSSKHDKAIYEVLRVFIRYYLALTMFNYGFSKIFHQQMQPLTSYRLNETYGNSSPMGLLWAFIGYSAGYSFFTGSVEVLGGALVLFRRTTTLGALVIAAAMLNVELLNLNYDVPVKLGAAHLLLMAVVLLAPDFRRLVDMFLLNRPTQPLDLSRNWPRPWMGKTALVVKVVVIVVLVASSLAGPIVRAVFMPPRADTSAYPLINRGFHWINEKPYAR